MKHRRGSAYIYVLLMVLAITIIGMAASDASMSFILTQRRIENKAKVDLVLSGAIDYFDADRLQTRVELPHSRTVPIDNVSVSVSAEDNVAAPGSIKVTATCTYRDHQYKKVSYIAKDRFSPFQYALAAGEDLDSATITVTGALGANGNVFGDKVTLSNLLNVINGDVDSPAPSVNGVITGGTYRKQGKILFPKPSLVNYLTSATTVLTGDQTFTNYAFPAVAAGAQYPLVFVNGKVNIKGSISGVGTIYAKGDIIVNGAMSYANASSRIALISDGSINVGGFDCVGYLYAENDVNLTGLLGGNPRGAIIAVKDLRISRTLTFTVTHDPAVTTDTNEGVRMHLPAYWP